MQNPKQGQTSTGKRSSVPNPEKERCLQDALAHTFTVEELKDRLKNNNVSLFLEFLKKLKIDTTPEQKQSPDVILDILAKKLVTTEGKKQASKILGLVTFKDLYSIRQSQQSAQSAQSQSDPNPRELASIQQREDMIQQYHRSQLAQNQQALQVAAERAQQAQVPQSQQPQELQQQKQDLKMTAQKIEQSRIAAKQVFDQMQPKPSIFNITYDQLKLQQTPQPFYNKRNTTCMCSQQASEITCQTCQVGFHKTCMKQAAQMKQFMCPSCQLNLLDPTTIPVMHLLEPFIVMRGGADDEVFPEIKLFEFKDQAKTMVAQRKDLSIQLRCLQLGDALVHAMPKFGALRFCGDRRNHQVFKIQDPPNDRKRKDKVMDLTQLICKDVQPIRQNQFSMEIMHKVKHEGDNKLWYVAGVYICKQFGIQEIFNYVETLQPRLWFHQTYDKIKKWHQQRDEDDIQVATKVITISLICKISMCPMKTPVKGQWCDHYECFDLNTYVESNIKAQIWKCPVCPSDKPVSLFRDEFMMALIESSKGETEAEIDYETLEVKFNHRVYNLTPEGLQPKDQSSIQTFSDSGSVSGTVRLQSNEQSQNGNSVKLPDSQQSVLGKRMFSGEEFPNQSQQLQQLQPSQQLAILQQQQQILYQQKRQQLSSGNTNQQPITTHHQQQPLYPESSMTQIQMQIPVQQTHYIGTNQSQMLMRQQSPQHHVSYLALPQQLAPMPSINQAPVAMMRQQITLPRNQQELAMSREATFRATMPSQPVPHLQQEFHQQNQMPAQEQNGSVRQRLATDQFGQNRAAPHFQPTQPIAALRKPNNVPSDDNVIELE